MNYASLPGWRRPVAAITDPDTERTGLREVIYELLGDGPSTGEQLAADIREHWGEATPQQIGRALAELRRSRAILRVGDRYARSEP